MKKSHQSQKWSKRRPRKRSTRRSQKRSTRRRSKRSRSKTYQCAHMQTFRSSLKNSGLPSSQEARREMVPEEQTREDLGLRTIIRTFVGMFGPGQEATSQEATSEVGEASVPTLPALLTLGQGHLKDNTITLGLVISSISDEELPQYPHTAKIKKAIAKTENYIEQNLQNENKSKENQVVMGTIAGTGAGLGALGVATSMIFTLPTASALVLYFGVSIASLPTLITSLIYDIQSGDLKACIQELISKKKLELQDPSEPIGKYLIKDDSPPSDSHRTFETPALQPVVDSPLSDSHETVEMQPVNVPE